MEIKHQKVRRELYGEEGLPRLAEAREIHPRTWENFEAGVAIPARVILDFILLTGASPLWLARGEGQPYTDSPSDWNAAS